ncbi:MAG: VWA domain-containing protein [Treponema sp.]|jgi:uncharacterized protein YegL|nr:VWA domain-containing protein [Treponema sp.]
MSLTDEAEAIPRKTMVLFFLIDTSGSMVGDKIGAINSAIEEVIPDLRDLSASNADAQIKVAALEFASGVRWITANGPVDLEQFRWNYLDASGVTDLGDACKSLHEKLSTKAFMREATGSFAPAIFLLSDGEPTDDYEGGLSLLKQNNWFKQAIKVAVAIGEDANKTVLEQFTGTAEAVLEVHNRAMLKKMIKFVSVRASEVASKSVHIGDLRDADSGTKQQDLNNQLGEIREEGANANADEEW